MSAVNVRESGLETKGWITFSAGGLNRARAWNKKLLENGLTQDIIEEMYLNATQLGYDRAFDLRMNPADFAAYMGPEFKVRVINLVNLK